MESSNCGFVVPPLASSSGQTFHKGDFVRRHGLRTTSMNNKVGVVCDYDESSGRFGLRLHRDEACEAFLPKNLQSYVSLPNDTCDICNE